MARSGRARLSAVVGMMVAGTVPSFLMSLASPAHAAPVTQMGATPPAAAPSSPSPAPALSPPSSPPAPVASPPAAESPPPSAPPSAPVTPPALSLGAGAPEVAALIPTADATPSPSDHDAVVGHWGLEARRLSPGPYPLTLRPMRGCPSTVTTPCTVDLGLLGVRVWTTRGLALNAGVALALGGGKEGTRTLDSYVGGGPQLGLTLLLGNWRHLAVGASPSLGVFMFKPGGGTTSSTVVVDLRMAIEGELHFGFVGVPALSVGIASGLGFLYESTPDASVWSIGVVGPTSAWGVLTDLFLRYYL